MGFDFSEGTVSYQKEQLALCNIIYIEKNTDVFNSDEIKIIK